MFTIVFGIHSYFFIALPIQLKHCRSNVFFLFYKTKCARQKNRELLRGFALPRAPDWHRLPNLSRNVIVGKAYQEGQGFRKIFRVLNDS